MNDLTEWLREFLEAHKDAIIEYGTDWVIRSAVDLRGSRPRHETRKLCAELFDVNVELLLRESSGNKKRAEFIDFVTSYRANQDFKVSTLLRGFLSFKCGVRHVLDERDIPVETKLAVMDRVDNLYHSSIFQMADVYVDKLKAIIEERQGQLRERDREVARLERELTESLLKRFLAPSVVDEIVRGERSLDQKPKSMFVTVMFADLVDFTTLTQRMESERLAEVLNKFLASMSEIVFFHKGTIDKFLGDGVMSLFGAPVAMRPKEQAAFAVRCAANMQRALLDLEDEPVMAGISLSMRIGIDCGPVVVGAFGNAYRSDFTAMGMHVNRARRIQALCKPGEIYVTNEVSRYLPPNHVEPCGSFQLKGLQGSVPLYRVVQSLVAF